jgi:hypothetical protein
MRINFKAIVDAYKLPTHLPLLPLFEAIINSIQSIEEAGIDDGQITITVVRAPSLLQGESWETDVDSFEIVDNGVGFNERNFTSFDIYGSDYKLSMGCKGVGRVLWLKAFSKVHIESTYLGEDGRYYDRSFDFSASEERKEISNLVSQKTQSGTKVVLDGYAPRYKSKCPKRMETLAREIMNHCFTYLALGTCPRIIITDEQGSMCINSVFQEYTKGQLSVVGLDVGGNALSLISAKNYAPSIDKHILHFCAHNREVFGDNLANSIRELTGRLFNEDGEFTYCGYITGGILDENINNERTEFAFSKANIESKEEDEHEQLELDEADTSKTISKKDINSAVAPIIREFLRHEIVAYNSQKKERIERYVFGKNPRYRSLIKHCEGCVESIPLTSDDDKLELELFRQEQAFRLRLKQEEREYIGGDIDSIEDYADYEDRCAAHLQKIADIGKDDLADYIIHRKTMLDILAHNLSFADKEKKRYAMERSVHTLIFPMVTTSDDMDYEKHNLWIIDEKLAYHYYLASDKPLSTYAVMDSDSHKEPDIAIFEPAFALTSDSPDSDLNNITIIEFKRPGRSDVECVDQVTQYIKLIREGKCKDKNGRMLAEVNGKAIRFSCYILSDLPGSMTEFLEGRNFRKTPDGQGYYLYHDHYNAYIEVLPYSKMIRDSERRNKILFDRLFCQSPPTR